jgi:hypothetical protein
VRDLKNELKPPWINVFSLQQLHSQRSVVLAQILKKMQLKRPLKVIYSWLKKSFSP